MGLQSEPEPSVDRTQAYHFYRSEPMIGSNNYRLESLLCPKNTVTLVIYVNGFPLSSHRIETVSNPVVIDWFEQIPTNQAEFCQFHFELYCREKLGEQLHKQFALNRVLDNSPKIQGVKDYKNIRFSEGIMIAKH